jgi:hypothetical protein
MDRCTCLSVCPCHRPMRLSVGPCHGPMRVSVCLSVCTLQAPKPRSRLVVVFLEPCVSCRSSLKPIRHTWPRLACIIRHLVPIWQPPIGAPSLKPIGHTWPRLACMIGYLVPIWQPSIGASSRNPIGHTRPRLACIIGHLVPIRHPLAGSSFQLWASCARRERVGGAGAVGRAVARAVPRREA